MFTMARRLVSLLPNAFFVFYCTAVGVYLLLRPWAARASTFPPSGFLRGFVSGLGLIHLGAAFIDLRVLSRDITAPGEEP